MLAIILVMNEFVVSGEVKRFPGKMGWHYVELPEGLSTDLRPLIADLWPALLRAQFSLGDTTWESSIMPIKDGPLFIALPAKVRRSASIAEGQQISVHVLLSV